MAGSKQEIISKGSYVSKSFSNAPVIPTYTPTNAYQWDGVDSYGDYTESTLSGGYTDPWSLSVKIEVNGSGNQIIAFQENIQGIFVYLNNVAGTFFPQTISLDSTGSSSNRLLTRSATGFTPTPGIKIHLVVTFDGTDANGFTYYVDGIDKGLNVIENDAGWSGLEWGTVRIGRSTTVYNDCKMADWRFFDRELNSSEVIDVQSGIILGDEHQWFKMDQIVGSTMPASAGVNGTVYNDDPGFVTTW